jgi:hypothetical protein
MAKIGLIAMSAKPYHAGHDGLIRLASKECDTVNLYVSIADRARSGEVPILGKDMATLWNTLIEPSLPTNVIVTYGGSPVGNIWAFLGKANLAGSPDEFLIYGDPTDLTQNFTKELLTKYSGNLFAAGQIKLRAVERSSTVDVSGTQMRQHLEKGDKAAFVKNLPSTIDVDKVWDILHATAKNPPKVKTTAGSVRKPAAKKPTQ